MEWNDEKKEASASTRAYQRAFAQKLDIDMAHADNEEVALAASHCLYRTEDKKIMGNGKEPVWDLSEYAFLKEDAVADTVNPSLWLNAKANYKAGLFWVVKDKIFQVRGYDLANITFIRSKTGFIVLDTGSIVESARAAMETVEQTLGESIHDKIRAVIISHSHGDHYGGVAGIVSPEQVGRAEDGKIPIYVPAGFDEECVSESVYAGTAMSRRGRYQFAYGSRPGVKSVVSAGLGLSGNIGAGNGSYIRPTHEIQKDQTLLIDGLTVEFQLTPGTEAPAEMNNYFPEYRAFWAAENCTGTLHNLYPIRGAKVRDAKIWAEFTIEALERYGDRTDVVFQSHHWPHWNTKEHPTAVKDFLRNSAAAYKYIHDQTLLYANQGNTPDEIAQKLTMPETLQKAWYVRPYYGSVEVNARAVYQRYLGYYHGNPVGLNPLTELETARKFVEYVGSEEAVLQKAKEDFEKGNYQWAATAANYVVYVNPNNKKARYLCADALEQLGYRAESSIWRNAYLIGADELRHGAPQVNKGTSDVTRKGAILDQIPVDLALGYLGIVIDGKRAAGEDLRFRLQITDDQGKITENYILHLYAGCLLTYRGEGRKEETLPFVKAPAELVTALIRKQLDSLKDRIETDCYEWLQKIQDYVVDLSEYSQFPIMER